MSNTFYTKETLNHFRKPHNYGELKNASGKGEAGNIVCGDLMNLYIRVKKDRKGNEVISDITFKTYGCAAAIATSSVITDLVKGKTIDEALKIDKSAIVSTLKGLPPVKIHCSILAIDALGEAIYQFLISRKRTIPQHLQMKHDRIEKAKQQLRERYKAWMNASNEKT